MGDPEVTKLDIEISASDATDEELDRMTRQLLSEIRQLDVESADLERSGAAPAGSKGDPVTLGAIAVVTLPAVLPKIIESLQAWASRGQARTVKFKGQGIEFEGPADELRKLLETLDKGKTT